MRLKMVFLNIILPNCHRYAVKTGKQHYMTGLRNPRPAQQQKIIVGIHRIWIDFLSVI
jgi:hypothetical protein